MWGDWRINWDDGHKMSSLVPDTVGFLPPSSFLNFEHNCLIHSTHSINFIVRIADMIEQIPLGFDPFIPEILQYPMHCDLFD